MKLYSVLRLPTSSLRPHHKINPQVKILTRAAKIKGADCANNRYSACMERFLVQNGKVALFTARQVRPAMQCFVAHRDKGSTPPNIVNDSERLGQTSVRAEFLLNLIICFCIYCKCTYLYFK